LEVRLSYSPPRVTGERAEHSYVDAVGFAPGAPANREIILTEEFRRALELLAGGRHLFLTGKAGTGKSTLIRRFLAETDRNVVVVAPTGIAALNVDGYTIHRLFGFRTTTTLHDVRGGAYRPGRFAKTLASLDTLIVD
jgi:ATP-dependent DNA helicase PIF1